MSFCGHCEGQRLDRAWVLRVLRATRKRLREPNAAGSAGQTLASALKLCVPLDIPNSTAQSARARRHNFYQDPLPPRRNQLALF